MPNIAELRKLLAEYHANPQCRCPGWGDHPGHTKKAIEIQPQHLEALLDAVEERDELLKLTSDPIAYANELAERFRGERNGLVAKCSEYRTRAEQAEFSLSEMRKENERLRAFASEALTPQPSPKEE